MALFDKLSPRFSSKETEIYNYRCLECTTEFETSEGTPRLARCPTCGASGSMQLDVQ